MHRVHSIGRSIPVAATLTATLAAWLITTSSLALAQGTPTNSAPTIAAPSTVPHTATLHITIPDVASADGAIRVFVYDSADSFRDQDKALAKASAPAQPGPLTIPIAGLSPGRHAVILYHDENNNGDLDRFLGMIPTEGYGVSNNPSLSGPPSFEEAAISIPAGDTRLTVSLQY